jgi:Na+:H+ antiporter, NhaA family
MDENHDPIKPTSALRAFLRSEAIGGILLMAAAALALVIANSPFAGTYFHAIHAPIGPVISPQMGAMTVHAWVNDVLMAIFFLLVGLEIKREFLDGELVSAQARRLPMISAAAGMAVPAFVYILITGADPEYLRGWAIPAATDIAFAIGVLALLGSRAPPALKLFLTTVAIADDMGAVVIIALFYSAQINIAALLVAALIWAVMMALNKAKVHAIWPYALLSAALWYAMMLSGVHATIAGVLAAFAIPFQRSIAAPDAKNSALHRLEHMLHKPVAFFIVPLFGFANAGVSFSGHELHETLPLAIAAGLFFGKQAGIFGSIWIAVKCGIAMRPGNCSWMQIYGVSLLCGIGFTMSLFIGDLAFSDPALKEELKIGVLAGSILSALAGWIILRLSSALAQPHP